MRAETTLYSKLVLRIIRLLAKRVLRASRSWPGHVTSTNCIPAGNLPKAAPHPHPILRCVRAPLCSIGPVVLLGPGPHHQKRTGANATDNTIKKFHFKGDDNRTVRASRDVK